MSSSSSLPLSTVLSTVYRRLPVRRRRQVWIVALMMLLGAVAELAALGAVIPFLTALANPSKLTEVRGIAALLDVFGARTTADALTVVTVLFVGATIVAAAIRVHLAWISQHFVYRVGHDIAKEVQRRVLYQPYLYHVTTNTSDILSSLEKIALLVYNVLLQVMQAAVSALIALAVCVAMFLISPTVTTISAVGLGLIYVGVTLATKRRLKHNSDAMSSAMGERIKNVQESLGGIRDILIDKTHEVYLNAFGKVDRRLSDARASSSFIASSPRFVIEAGAMVLLALVGLMTANEPGGLATALPVLGALAIGAQRVLPLIQQVYHAWSAISANRSIADEILQFLELPLPDQPVAQAHEALRFSRGIELQQVTFVYPERSVPAVKDLSLTIPQGARVGFIGQTGSGKSTLLDLLMGLLQPTSGRILVDGKPLAGATLDAWHEAIAHVPQNIFLADTTIAGNIALGDHQNIDMDRVVRAAEIAQVHGFITSLEEGYDTRVGERGVRLSGGQRQRLGIARALYKRASVLVLDEATSALDDATEAALIRSLGELEESLTIIMVAHRLSTIANCNLVVRLQQGQLVQAGSYAEVVSAADASA